MKRKQSRNSGDRKEHSKNRPHAPDLRKRKLERDLRRQEHGRFSDDMDDGR